jgi:flagellar motor switch protein FliG
MQELLIDLDDREAAILVKGKSEEIRSWIYDNMSERRREIVEAFRESLGPMRRREVDRVTGDFLHRLRRLAEAGELTIPAPDSDGSEYVE